MIPNILHFIIHNELLFCNYLSIITAYVINRPSTIYIHTPLDMDILNCKYISKLLDNCKINITVIKYENESTNSLTILYKYGGVIMDVSTLSYNSYSKLLNNKCVLFKHYYSIPIENNISNTLIMSVVKSEFIQKLQDMNEKGGHNSIKYILPLELQSNNKYDFKYITDYSYLFTSLNIFADTIIPNEMILININIDDAHYNIFNELENTNEYGRGNNIYNKLIKNYKQKCIETTPYIDSIYYAIINLLISIDKLPDIYSLDTKLQNVNIVSIEYTKTYFKAVCQLKENIIKQCIVENINNPNINDIINIVSLLFSITISIVTIDNVKMINNIHQLICIDTNYYVTLVI